METVRSIETNAADRDGESATTVVAFERGRALHGVEARQVVEARQFVAANRVLEDKQALDPEQALEAGQDETKQRQEGVPALEPTAKVTQASPPAAEAKATVKKRKGRVVLPILLLAALGAGGYYGHSWWTNGRFFVSTDDAYVQADVATLGTKVAGYIAGVKVREGDTVSRGDVVATLDDTDFRLALATAEAKRATQSATIQRIDRQVAAQAAQIESSRAAVTSAEAESIRAASAYDRAQTLAKQSFQTKAALDQTVADRDRAVAAIASAKAMVDAAQANLDVVKAQKAEAEQVARELDTAVDKAKSDLAYTVIRAPSDGVVGNRAAQPGQYVSPGSRLMALVPMPSVYIAANFKETQLAATARRTGRGSRDRFAARPQLQGADREHRAGLGLDVQPAAAGERHRQLHQDHAARAGAHRSPRGRRGRRPAAAGPVGRRLGRHPDVDATRLLAPDPNHREAAMAAATLAAPAAPADTIDKRKLIAFLGMVFGMFMAILDIQIVSASLADIQAGLGASADEISVGADGLPDRRSHHDPAVGLSCRGSFRRAGSSRFRRAASR